MSAIGRRHYELREQFPSLRDVGVAARHFPDYRSPRHDAALSHDTLYCSLLLRGNATHHVDDQVFAEQAGHLTVVAQGATHQIVTGRESVEVFNLHLDPDRYPLPKVPTVLSAPLQALLPLHSGFAHRLNRLTSVKLREPRRTAEWLHGMQREQEDPSPGARAALESLLRLVLIDLARACTDQDAVRQAGSSDDPLMEAIRMDLDARFAEPIRIAALARRANLSPEHLSRRFTRHAGVPPARYLHLKRLHEAMVRLRTGGGRILDLALACGFADLAHFNRSFKAVTGCTPSLYRKRFVE